MRLTTLVPLQGLAFPGLRASQLMTIHPGVSPASYKDWRIHVRGPSVFFISPPGWQIGKAASGSTRIAYELPRTHCYLGWDMEPGDKLDGVSKYDPPCDGCGKPIALEDHLLCAACERKRDADVAKLAADVAKHGGRPDRIAIHPDRIDQALAAGRDVEFVTTTDPTSPLVPRAEPSLGLTVEGANPESPPPTATVRPTFSDDAFEDDVKPRGKRR